MRLAMLVAAACLGLGAMAHADGKEGQRRTAPLINPLTPNQSAPAPVSYQGPGHEPGIYRFGATYAVRASSTVLDCEAVCTAEEACQSWSFVDTYGNSPARCELKRGAGKREENRLATSGTSQRLKTAMWGEAPPAYTAPAAPSNNDSLKGGPLSMETTGEAALETASLEAMPELAPSSP